MEEDRLTAKREFEIDLQNQIRNLKEQNEIIKVTKEYDDTQLASFIEKLRKMNTSLKEENQQLKHRLSGTKNDAQHWETNHKIEMENMTTVKYLND